VFYGNELAARSTGQVPPVTEKLVLLFLHRVPAELVTQCGKNFV